MKLYSPDSWRSHFPNFAVKVSLSRRVNKINRCLQKKRQNHIFNLKSWLSLLPSPCLHLLPCLSLTDHSFDQTRAFNSSHSVSIWIGPNWSAPAWNYLNPILAALHHLSWPHGPQKYPLTHLLDLGPDQQEFVLQPPVNRLADSLSTHHISSHHRTTDTGTAPLTLVAHPAWSQSTDPAWSDSGSPGSLPCRSFLVCQLVCLWSVLSGLPLLDATLRGFIGIHLCH